MGADPHPKASCITLRSAVRHPIAETTLGVSDLSVVFAGFDAGLGWTH